MTTIKIPVPQFTWCCDQCGYLWEEGIFFGYDGAKYQPCPNCGKKGWVHTLLQNGIDNEND